MVGKRATVPVKPARAPSISATAVMIFIAWLQRRARLFTPHLDVFAKM